MDRYVWIAEAARRLGVSQKTARKWFDGDNPEGEGVEPAPLKGRTVRLGGFRIPGSGYRRLTSESVDALARELHGSPTVNP